LLLKISPYLDEAELDCLYDPEFMVFSEPKFSRDAVDEAGEYLVTMDSDPKEINYDKLTESINR
jgi:hypothetical protein